MTLTDIANKLKLDKGTIIPNDGGHHGPRLHFTPVYEKYFNALKDLPINILEIGISTGNSLNLWTEFFPNANVYGIDIVDCKHMTRGKIKTFQCDQSNREEMKKIMEQLPLMDIIIDDGSHVISHQQITIATLFPFVKSKGMYWIEDLHTSDNQWQGKTLYGNDMSFKNDDSTVDFINRAINGNYTSSFMTNEELVYLKANMDFIKLFHLPKTFYGENKICLFQKS